MKKTILTLILFLSVSLAINAQTFKVVKCAVGTGGFVGKTTSVGKMSGLFGQAIIGKLKPTIDGTVHTMYLGFWSTIAEPVGIAEENILQKEISNYPNPVSDVTNFSFNLSEPSYITIRVYNSLGSLVATVADNEMYAEGSNSVLWNVRNTNVDLLSTGSYKYEMMVVPVNYGASKASPTLFRNTMVISK